MFGFLKARKAGRTRRHARLRWQTVRSSCMALVALGVIGGAVFMFSAHATAAAWRGDLQQHWNRAAIALGFEVREILVIGRQQISEDELLAHLGITTGTPIFSVDLDTAQKLIHEIKWIDEARVSRRLPDKIIVTLKERVPVALWQYQKKISLIDAEGHVIRDHDLDAYRHLPLVVGIDAPAHVGELARLMQAEPTLAADLASASRVGKRRWDLRLQNGLVIRLPEKNVELALSQLVRAARDEGLLDKDIQVIDLRLPEKLTVTPATVTTTTADTAKKKNI